MLESSRTSRLDGMGRGLVRNIWTGPCFPQFERWADPREWTLLVWEGLYSHASLGLGFPDKVRRGWANPEQILSLVSVFGSPIAQWSFE